MNQKLRFNRLEYAGIISSCAIIALCIGASNFTQAQDAQIITQGQSPANQTRIFKQEDRAALLAAINSPMRIDAARDKYRNPAQTLEFFGILPSDTIIEIWPGQGWYSSILGPYLKSGNGRYIGAHFDTASTSSNLVKQIVENFRNRFGAKPSEFGDLAIVPFGPRSRALGPENSVDAVLTFRNIHNWMAQGWAEKAFDDFYKVLKPGGILGVEEHRADDNSPQDPLAEDGYVREDYVIDMAKEAGFELVGRSQINANPKDSKDHPFGVWTLPPVGRTSAPGQPENLNFDKSRYLEIGESDRMTLLFRKPIAPPTPPKANNTIAGIRVPFPIKVISAPKAPPVNSPNNQSANKKDQKIETSALPPLSEPNKNSNNASSEPKSNPSAAIPPLNGAETAKTDNIPAWRPKISVPKTKTSQTAAAPPPANPASPPIVFEVPVAKADENATTNSGSETNPSNNIEPKANVENAVLPAQAEIKSEQTKSQPKALPKTQPSTRTNTRRPSPPPPPRANTTRPNANDTNKENNRPVAARPSPASAAAKKPSPPPPRPVPKAKAPEPKTKAPAPKAKSAPPRPSQSAPKAKPKALNIPTWNPNPPKKK